MTALDYAARTGMPETVDLLVQHGATIETQDLTQALYFCTEHWEEKLRWDHEIESHDRTSARRNRSLVQTSIRKGHDQDLSRGLAVGTMSKKDRRQSKKIGSNIRHCVRRLLVALDNVEAIFSSLPILPGNHQRDGLVQRSAFRGAVEKDCEAVIEEFTIALAKTNTPVFTHGISTLQFDFRRTLHLKSIEHRAADFRAAVGDIKEVESRETLIHDCVKDGQLHVIDLYDADMDPWNCTHSKTMLFDLVNEGKYEALGRLALRYNFRDRPCPLSDYKDRSWSQQTGSFELFDIAEASAWDVLLAHACDRDLPNLPVIKVLLQQVPVTSLGHVVAVFTLAACQAAWTVEALEHMLSLGVDPNSRNSKGSTPLHAACGSMSRSYVDETIQCLLDHGADITIGRPHFLNTAIRAQQTGVVKLLIEQGAVLNTRSSDEEIGREFAECNQQSNPRGMTMDQHLDYSFPLHLTTCMSLTDSRRDPNAESRRQETLELLLQGGADPNMITHTGAPIVHETIGRNGPNGTESVRGLLRHASLDLSRRDIDGNTVLLALADGLSSKFRFGRVESGDFSLLSELISRGSDITATNHKGQNVLHLLLQSIEYIPWSPDQLEFLHMCQERGLINASDDNGVRPITICLGAQNWKGVELLLELGADLAMPDRYGNTAFHHLAKSLYSLDIKETLSFASIRKPRKALNTPIESAESATKEGAMKNVEEKFHHLDKMLKNLNININACNQAGDPPFFELLRTCSLTHREYNDSLSAEDPAEKFLHRMQLFIDAGADIHIKAPNGQGALHVLAPLGIKAGQLTSRGTLKKGDDRPLLAAWKRLVADGFDPYMEDDEQRTAIDIAAVSGNVAILELY